MSKFTAFCKQQAQGAWAAARVRRSCGLALGSAIALGLAACGGGTAHTGAGRTPAKANYTQRAEHLLATDGTVGYYNTGPYNIAEAAASSSLNASYALGGVRPGKVTNVQCTQLSARHYSCTARYVVEDGSLKTLRFAVRASVACSPRGNCTWRLDSTPRPLRN